MKRLVAIRAATSQSRRGRRIKAGLLASLPEHIFSLGLATVEHAMSSREALGSPMPEFPGTPDVELVLDGPDKPFEHVPMVDRKRTRSSLAEEDISVFTNMTEAMKEVATVIRESKSFDVQPEVYNAFMEQGGFDDEALMASLSHPLDNKAKCFGFVAMAGAHKDEWYVVFDGRHQGFTVHGKLAMNNF
ncbi:Translational activator GCN1 [Hordeum vulgare]|nr:Translational activator GCN1 [Hordeum vulgare]